MRVPRFRLSVRALLLVVLLVGGGFGWTIRSVRIQCDAVRVIEEAGGRADYEWRWSGGRYFPAGSPPGPRWLHAYVGPDLFGHVTAVWLNYCGTSDESLLQIGQFHKLEHLSIYWSNVSDSGMAHLAGLKRLEWLDLGFSTVNDAGMVHLAGLTGIKTLHLNFTQVGDSGVAHLAGMKRLEELILAGTRISDASLVSLKGMTGLKKLDVAVTSVSPNGLRRLKAALPRLKIRQ
jgi:hypothetical protein